MNSFKRIAATAAFLACAGTPLVAQVSATVNISASAFIAGQAPIAVARNLNLMFGTAGSPISAGAGPTAGSQTGLVTVTGEPNTPFTVDFTLPTILSNGANTIAITFGATDGIDWTDFASSTVNANFDPGLTYVATLNATGVKEIGLDGSIDPPLGTISGNYTGTITIDVAY